MCVWDAELARRAVNRKGKIESRGLPRQNHVSMPSVGMRRTTRVFGARVLRSGRRLWTGPGEGKHMRVGEGKHLRPADGEEWIELLENSEDGGVDAIQCKENGWHDDAGSKQEIADIDIDKKTGEHELGKSGSSCLVDDNLVDRMWGNFYQRKRKRLDSECFDFSGNSDKKRVSDRRYGKQFFRKHKRIRESPLAEACDLKSGFVGQDFLQRSLTCQVLVAVVESSCSSSFWFSCFLNSLLRYMRSARVRLPQLSAFLFSEPIASVYSAHGIQFLQDSASLQSSGVCKILGSRDFIPLFAVDFPAVPLCFMYMHASLLLRSAYLPNVLVIYSEGVNAKDDRVTDDEESPSCIPCDVDQSGSKTVPSANGNSGKGRVLHLTVVAPKLTGRTLQSRNGVSSRGIQKRRSSLRPRRGKNPSAFGMRKANGSLVTDLFFRHDGIPSSSVAFNCELISSARRSFTTNIKELKSTVVGLTQDIDSTSCSANILVIESDKCYREEAATITLEISASKQWFLAVKRDGIRRYSLTAKKVMRPCCSNRFSHAIIWAVDNGWKLEFPNRQDWLIFKELYKECSDRNAQVSTINIIPVPGVREVSGYADNNNVPFSRPDSYITWKDDEVARALAKSTANYDMDSDDEEWLNKFNESCAESELDKRVSADTFELIVNAFDKGFYFSPDDYSDVKTAVNLCLDVERREVLEAVHSYWMKKRKQKRGALVRVFQCYQPRRAQLLPKSVRKKRSFKRQASQAGRRGKQRTFLQAMATEQDALEEQNAILKVKEAKAAADRSEGMAVLKRQRAQLLMQTADLATFKATVALRIAEAARVSESSDAAASFFLG